MPRKKECTICAKVERPRRSIVRKENETTIKTFNIRKCDKDKKKENALKKRMMFIDNLIIKEMHGKITITKKLVLKYLKELKEMRVHCTREDLRQVYEGLFFIEVAREAKQDFQWRSSIYKLYSATCSRWRDIKFVNKVNEKLLRCMEICLTADKHRKDLNTSIKNKPIEEIIIPENSQNIVPKYFYSSNNITTDNNGEEKNMIRDSPIEENFNFFSYNNEIIGRGNTPVLRSDQTTPSNIDIQEIMGRDKEEFYTNTKNTPNVIGSFNLKSLNDIHNTQIRSEITPKGHLTITPSKSIVKANLNDITTGNTSTTQSEYIDYDTLTFQSDIICDSQSLLNQQKKTEFHTTDVNTLLVDSVLKNRNIEDSITISNNFDDNSDDIESQSILKAQDIKFNSEITENTSDTNEKAGKIFKDSENATESSKSTKLASFQLLDVVEETIHSDKIIKKNIAHISFSDTEPLSKKLKVSYKRRKNVKKSRSKNNIDDSKSDLYISPKIEIKVSCNGNETMCNQNTKCSTSSSQEIIPDSMTECTNFSITCDKMQTQKIDLTQNCDWSKDMNLNCIKNVQFIRTIEEEEFMSAGNLTDTFWNDDSVPSELIRDFD